MKKTTVLFLLVFAVAFVKAQDESAINLLKKYGFTSESVLSIIDLSSAHYSFKAQSTSTTNTESGKPTIKEQVYRFDSNKKQGERFTLITVDGNNPRKIEVKRFNKQKNQVDESQKSKLSDDDFFVESNDENQAVIGFNIPADKVNSKIAFMAHCNGFIIIDKKSGRIIKIQIKSKEAFNIKIFHVTSMLINIKLSYDKSSKQYYVTKESIETKALLLGSTATITTEEIYSDFKFN